MKNDVCIAVYALAPAPFIGFDHELKYIKSFKNSLSNCSCIIENSGAVPNELNALLKLPGVGRKTANIVLSAGFNMDTIAVDTHVHRITNRLGWVHTKTPEDTEMELKKIIPKKYWHRLNGTLVVFGQTVCKPVSPKCKICPVNKYCPSRKL